MTNVKFATSLPEDAVQAARDHAAGAGVTIGEWIARAIRDKAIRDGLTSLHAALDADPELKLEWEHRHDANERETDRLLDGPAGQPS